MFAFVKLPAFTLRITFIRIHTWFDGFIVSQVFTRPCVPEIVSKSRVTRDAAIADNFKLLSTRHLPLSASHNAIGSPRSVA